MRTVEELKNVYIKYWDNEQELFVMPYTIRARAYLQKIGNDIFVKGILDNNEAVASSNFCDMPILFAKDELDCSERKKILISAHYKEISEQLNELGYKEFVDYIDMHAYVSMWYWFHKNEIHLLDVHTAITTYCSLNCSNCNMFLNRYKLEQRKNYSLKEFQEDYEALFRVADYCYKVTLLGGEPLLNKELPQMLKWLKETYGEKIGEINIVTNGTIIPNKELIDTIRETNAILQVSDYGIDEKYNNRLAELEVYLQDEKVKYHINHEMKWKDFYFPRTQQGASFNSFREHMLCCNPVFRGLNDKKFYYCHIIWSAGQAGLWTAQSNEYISLDKVSDNAERETFLAYDLGYMESEYVSLCEVCGGCGIDNQSVIEAGVQE